MFDYFPNRRAERSDNMYDALTLQLKATAKRAGFSSIVLADETGLVVASAGNKSVSEYLAAMSPGLAAGSKTWNGKLLTNKGKVPLSIAPIRFGDTFLYLSATEGMKRAISRELFLGGRGVVRILNN